jgi:hypothetical protein
MTVPPEKGRALRIGTPHATGDDLPASLVLRRLALPRTSG